MSADLLRQGTVQSHTVIRLPGKAHAADAPLVLLLVRLDNGHQVLGHFRGREPPPIDSRVRIIGSDSTTPSFTIFEDIA